MFACGRAQGSGTAACLRPTDGRRYGRSRRKQFLHTREFWTCTRRIGQSRDTTGAGDCCFAVFIHEFLRQELSATAKDQKRLTAALEYANHAASYCVMRRGALTPCRGGRIFAAKKRDGRHERSDFGGRTDWTGLSGQIGISIRREYHIRRQKREYRGGAQRPWRLSDRLFWAPTSGIVYRGYEALHLQHPAAAKRVAEADLVMTSVLAENWQGSCRCLSARFSARPASAHPCM